MTQSRPPRGVLGEARRAAVGARAAAGALGTRLFASFDARALFRLLSGRDPDTAEDAEITRVAPHGYVRTAAQARRLVALAPSSDALLFFRLAYGRPASPAEADAVAALLPDGVSRTADIRELLGHFDMQTHPTPLSVRFRRDDVVKVQCDGFSLYIDRADTSVSRVVADTGEFEPHVSATLRRLLHPGMTVVDVGANIGYHTFLAASIVGPDGHVVAVDPYSENCRLLLLSRSANQASNVTVLPVALAESPGHAYLGTHLGNNAGLLPDDDDALADGAGMVVPTVRLDDVVDGPVDLIKIDVEGAEHRVLRGAQRILDSRPILICEFSVEMIQRVSGVEPLAALHDIVDRGYAMHVLDRTTGAAVAYDTPESLLDQWPSAGHIEDLLFLPH